MEFNFSKMSVMRGAYISTKQILGERVHSFCTDKQMLCKWAGKGREGSGKHCSAHT